MRPVLRSLKLHVCPLVSVHGGGVPPIIPMTSRICSQILLLTNCCGCSRACGSCSYAWLDANAECARLHPSAKLASIHGFVENDVIYKMAVGDSTLVSDPYIGLFRSIKSMSNLTNNQIMNHSPLYI